ncbi:MAG: metal-dependent transcriptional regulator [Opitutaceae bacterium]|jgi:DtxR family Mn-dependent transcriptional regulator|nr:metal-dependent transcriptional regulator [Opitutaceae bacterium]
MFSSTVENYLKAILLHGEESGAGVMPPGALAEALDVSPGTVTTMVKALAEQGLLSHKPRAGVKLTKSGRAAAVRVLRKHRLVETFLVSALKMDWAGVHEEAEALEHAVSDRVLEKIDELLGHPAVDPHGDPIPNARGELAGGGGVGERLTLASCDVKTQWRVARIHDQAPAFLDFIRDTGLKPGARVRVVRRDEAGGVVRCEVKGEGGAGGAGGAGEAVLGLGEAGKIEVRK